MEMTFAFKVASPSPNDPVSIYHLAQSFYLAGNRCALNIEIAPRTTQSLTSPSVVNYCFSIELFCKALIQATGVKPRKIHKLDELFSAIPEPAQKAIAEIYGQHFQDPDLPTLLSQAANYFQEVRYEYDYNIFAFQEAPLAVLAKAAYWHCSDVLDPK